MAQSKLKGDLIRLCNAMRDSATEHACSDMRQLAYDRLNTTLHGIIDRASNEELSRVCHHNGLLTSIKELGL